MAIDIQDIINKKTNHLLELLELLKQKNDAVKEEPHEEEYDKPIIIEEKTPITDIVLRKIEKILDLLREKKNKTDNVKTLVETSLSVLLSVLNNQGKQSATFPELASAIMNNGSIDEYIENIEQPIPFEKIHVYADMAAELFSYTLSIDEDNIARDEIKKAIKLFEAFQKITTSNVEELVDISTKILQEISNTVSQIPVAQSGVQQGVQSGVQQLVDISTKILQEISNTVSQIPVVPPPGAQSYQQPATPVVQPVVQQGVQPGVQQGVQPGVQQGVQPGVQVPASTYYNSMIKKNSDIGTFLAAAIGNALIDNKPTMIQNILTGLTKTGAVFKNYFKGIHMNAMKERLTNLSLPSPTLPNVKLSLPATKDIFKLTIGFPFAFINYCAKQGIKIPQTIIDTFKQKVATTLVNTTSVTDSTQDKNNNINMDAETNKSAIDTQQKEVNCSDPNVIKLGQVEDTALCFDPKQNKVIATK